MNDKLEKTFLSRILTDIVNDADICEESDANTLVRYLNGSFYVTIDLVHAACRAAAREIDSEADVTWRNVRDSVIEHFGAEIVHDQGNYLKFKFQVIK